MEFPGLSDWICDVFRRVRAAGCMISSKGSSSPLHSMQTSNESSIAERHLRRALSYRLLHCIYVRPHWIEVCLQTDNVRCDVRPFESMNIITDFPNERHFAAKICLTIGPEKRCDVYTVSLTLSSHDLITDNGKENYWGFQQSVVNYSDAKIYWTLFDTTTGMAVFNNGLPKFSVLNPRTWSIDRYSKACRASTDEGGVVLDDNGYPIKWRFNKRLEGQTLKWIVKGSVWLTSWPNTHRTESKRHDFRQEFDLKLIESSASTQLEYLM